jgi:hypothetical protein
MEFEATVDENGKITVPPAMAQEIGREPLHVRLTEKTIASELKTRGVDEDEIDRIAALQMEPRENVLRFLLAEGALKSRTSPGRKR